MKHLRLKTISVAALLCAGCASVNVTKVTPSTGIAVAGAAEGIRYYMPRPYISVHEPFIVASEVHLANGEISPDGQYVLITGVAKSLTSIFDGLPVDEKSKGMGQMAIRASEVRAVAPPATNPMGGQQSAVDGDRPADPPKSTASAPAAASSAPTQTASAPASPASAPAPVKDSGILNYKVSNDNAAYAVTPQPRYYSILWLPDFDEQYAVTAKAGLGNAGVTINTGQGWSLQGLDAKVDNSAIAGPLLDFYKSTLGALSKVATAKIGGLAGAIGGQQSALGGDTGPTAKDTFSGGTKVTLKVTKVRVVAPGLYPILKPGEVKDIDAAITSAGADASKRILRPAPPLTNIAFNTYDVVVIEAARSTGDSALKINQYVDSGNAPVFSLPADKPTDKEADSTSESLKAPELAINKALKTLTTKSSEYFETKLTFDPASKIVAKVVRMKGGTPGSEEKIPTDEKIKEVIQATAKANGKTIAVDKITIDPIGK